MLNLFNQKTAVSKYSLTSGSMASTPDEAAFYSGQQTLEQLITSQNIAKDPRFLQDNLYQSPILARFGIRFVF